MGAGHTHALHHHGHSPVHLLAPEVKVAATVAFVVAVATTPATAPWAFALDAVLLAAVVAVARLPVAFVPRRLVVVLPFVAFAFLVPFVASGEQVEVLGVAVSREGLRGALNVLAKALLGAGASIVLAGTTEQARILEGLARLRVPRVLTTIAAFGLRYLEVVARDVGRMRVAMTARGHDPRWLAQAGPMAAGAGALFVRTYERGERVHAAMLARGFTGAMPDLHPDRGTLRQWAAAAVVPALAVGASLAANVAGA